LALLAIHNGPIAASADRVEDGEQALAYLYRQPPYHDHRNVDLILLDLKAARIDGVEVLRRIKADPELRALPVVVLSATLSQEDIDAAYRHHANSFLVKPLDFNEFQCMVNDLLTYWSQWNQAR